MLRADAIDWLPGIENLQVVAMSKAGVHLAGPKAGAFNSATLSLQRLRTDQGCSLLSLHATSPPPTLDSRRGELCGAHGIGV